MIDVRTSWNGCQPMSNDVRLCQAVGHQFGTRIASEQFPEFQLGSRFSLRTYRFQSDSASLTAVAF